MARNPRTREATVREPSEMPESNTPGDELRWSSVKFTLFARGGFGKSIRLQL